MLIGTVRLRKRRRGCARNSTLSPFNMTKQDYVKSIQSQCVEVALKATQDALADKMVELDAANAKIVELEAKLAPKVE